MEELQRKKEELEAEIAQNETDPDQVRYLGHTVIACYRFFSIFFVIANDLFRSTMSSADTIASTSTMSETMRRWAFVDFVRSLILIKVIRNLDKFDTCSCSM